MTFVQPSDDPATAVAQLGAWLDADDPDRLLIETSGSTGEPKRVVLSRDAVVASARASATRLVELGVEPGRWGLVLPASYVAGVQVVVRSLLAGETPQLGGWHASDFTSLVPTQLVRALDDAEETASLAGLRTVLLGGGPVDPTLRARAAAAGITVVATYGASETAGGCVYDGHPLDGVAVAIGTDGRIRLGGPTIFDGYDADPEMTAQALVDGWFVTSDAGRLDHDGRLQVVGRVDDVVVTGGVNVPLPAVARRLREHPAVRAAECLGVADAEWGTRVVAVVVGDVGLDAARDWVSESHPRAWAPRQVVVVDELPLLPTGKIDRRAVEELVS